MTTYKIILCAVISLLASPGAMAQSHESGNFAIKAHAQIGLGNAMNIESNINGMTGNCTADEYGVALGWRFWHKGCHSLEANIGVGYNSTTTKLNLPALSYSYATGASADMDGEPYIRYTEIDDMNQKISVSRLTVPVYLSYGIHCTGWLTVHADAGVRLGFKTTDNISSVSGQSYSYGIYPQYDDLKIDADYMNNFGHREIVANRTSAPNVASITVAILAGIGAEFKIYGPLSADVTLHYNAGLSNLYKIPTINNKNFTAETAPITYTVSEGTRIKPLTDYLISSKLSYLALNLSLIYRF